MKAYFHIALRSWKVVRRINEINKFFIDWVTSAFSFIASSVLSQAHSATSVLTNNFQNSMPCHMYVAVILLATCTMIASNSERSIDCRKFVFAPLCRGVAAKRGFMPNGQIQHGIILDATSLNELLRNFNPATEAPISEDKDDASLLRKSTFHEEPSENSSGTFKKDKLHPDHLLYTLFLGNKKRNNEVESIPLYEYENV